MRAKPAKPRVIAVAVADLHLSSEPPLFRSNEPDWWSAQQRPLDQLKELSALHGGAPILCAGDVLNRWRETPELISWAIRNLPVMYSIPGQHDLPYHRYEDIRKSAYWTLVEAGRLIDLKPGQAHPVSDGLQVVGFPWGSKVTPPPRAITGLSVALVHGFCWAKGAGYPGAPRDAWIGAWGVRLEGYDFGVIGDNHRPCAYEYGGTHVLVPGSLMRLTSAQRRHRPRAYLLWSDGDYSTEYLDTVKDVCLNEEEAPESEAREAVDAARILSTIAELKQERADFLETCKRLMEQIGVAEGVREKIMRSIEGAR
jgi:hypothetical protein